MWIFVAVALWLALGLCYLWIQWAEADQRLKWLLLQEELLAMRNSGKIADENPPRASYGEEEP
jgi:hypothetical protein